MQGFVVDNNEGGATVYVADDADGLRIACEFKDSRTAREFARENHIGLGPTEGLQLRGSGEGWCASSLYSSLSFSDPEWFYTLDFYGAKLRINTHVFASYSSYAFFYQLGDSPLDPILETFAPPLLTIKSVGFWSSQLVTGQMGQEYIQRLIKTFGREFFEDSIRTYILRALCSEDEFIRIEAFRAVGLSAREALGAKDKRVVARDGK